MSIQTWREVLITGQGAGPTLTSAAAATMLPGQAKFTLPANFFGYVGKMVKVTAYGIISSVITTPGTARFDIRLGGTVVWDSQAILLDTVAAHTNVGWKLEVDLVCRTDGASANLWGQGVWTCEDILGVPATAPKGVLSAILPWNTDPPTVGNNFDATAAQQVDSFFTQTVGTGSMTCEMFMLEALN